MKDRTNHLTLSRARGLMSCLASDPAGNTLALVAAALLPLMAMIGGGVDMGRSYLSQNRLQQACDAGVLAARKRLGTEALVTGDIPDDVSEVGQRFFHFNFQDGIFGTEPSTFSMELEEDYSISGTAEVDVPTTIMQAFGYENVPLTATCSSQLNMSDTDIMMVLDVTGSMAESNPGDGMSRITALKATVKSFYQQLAAASGNGTRIRYGFVPYSTNVNVGGLLLDDWVVDEWDYQSRKLLTETPSVGTHTYWTASSPVSGTRDTLPHSTYSASFSEMSGYYCPTVPANTLTTTYQTMGTTTETVVGPPAGTRTIVTEQRTRNGTTYSVSVSGSTCTVSKTVYTSYIDQYQKITEPRITSSSQWQYKQFKLDVSDWRTTSNGCMEERDTYEIDDYSDVDFSKALDLDIDRVPTAGDEKTQWRPMFPSIIYARAKEWSGSGSFTKNTEVTNKEFINPYWAGTAACPAPSKKLSVMTEAQLDAYLATLTPRGSTYHDIGMIWGGRLLSPTGLFASENADQSASQPTGRHMIFLTDGLTAPLDISYSSYGMEPVDQRRWKSGSAFTLTQTVENRFAVACAEVKKRNITVWVVGFGTTLNPIMEECAGPGHSFEADDAAELNETFGKIAKQIGELRITH